MTKKCSSCGEEKSQELFRKHSSHKNGIYSHCLDCVNASGKAKWIAVRDEVYAHYGGYRCACCGESNPLFLSIDHMNNDGHSHRNSNIQVRKLVLYLKSRGFPEGFQPLCYNCNMGKNRNGGICPHKKEKE